MLRVQINPYVNIYTYIELMNAITHGAARAVQNWQAPARTRAPRSRAVEDIRVRLRLYPNIYRPPPAQERATKRSERSARGTGDGGRVNSTGFRVHGSSAPSNPPRNALAAEIKKSKVRSFVFFRCSWATPRLLNSDAKGGIERRGHPVSKSQENLDFFFRRPADTRQARGAKPPR